MLNNDLDRRCWFISVQADLKTYRKILVEEIASIKDDNKYVSKIRREIVTEGICVLGRLTTKLIFKEKHSESFNYEDYDLADKENTLVRLTNDLLGSEETRHLYAAIMECEISLRNKCSKMSEKDIEEAVEKLALEQKLEECRRKTSECCCETEGSYVHLDPSMRCYTPRYIWDDLWESFFN